MNSFSAAGHCCCCSLSNECSGIAHQSRKVAQFQVDSEVLHISIKCELGKRVMSEILLLCRDEVDRNSSSILGGGQRHHFAQDQRGKDGLSHAYMHAIVHGHRETRSSRVWRRCVHHVLASQCAYCAEDTRVSFASALWLLAHCVVGISLRMCQDCEHRLRFCMIQRRLSWTK